LKLVVDMTANLRSVLRDQPQQPGQVGDRALIEIGHRGDLAAYRRSGDVARASNLANASPHSIGVGESPDKMLSRR
jgi:hypothetical protein